MAVYPSNMAPVDVKLWENAFQTIPDISFFNAQNIFLAIFLSKILVSTFASRILHFGGASNF